MRLLPQPIALRTENVGAAHKLLHHDQDHEKYETLLPLCMRILYEHPILYL